jgi:hypothetical protein
MFLDWPLIGSNFAALLLLTAGVAGFMYRIRWAIARKSPRHEFVGWFGYGFAVSNFFGWGIPALTEKPGFYHNIGSMIGLGFGLVLGLGIGEFIWRHYRRKPDEE